MAEKAEKIKKENRLQRWWRETIGELRTQSESQAAQLDAQARVIADLNCENDDLRDWAERLVSQVRELNGEPVKIRPRAKASK